MTALQKAVLFYNKDGLGVPLVEADNPYISSDV